MSYHNGNKCFYIFVSNLVAFVSNLVAFVSNLVAFVSNLVAFVSNLVAFLLYHFLRVFACSAVSSYTLLEICSHNTCSSVNEQPRA